MTMKIAIAAPRIFDGEHWHEDAVLVVADGRISALLPRAALDADTPLETRTEGFLAPGFVDLQVNGGGGELLNNAPSLDGIRQICAAHIRFGTTSLLPTLISDTPDVRDAAIAAGVAAAKAGVPGFAGLHLEGPHLSRARQGAHDPALIRPMSDADVTALVAARATLPYLMTTVAPEAVTPAQVRALTAASIGVSIGHSDAPIEAALALAEAGASMVTHLFNAMSQMTGREPGLVGAALGSGSLSASLICDGFHVHPHSMRIALRAKTGPGRIFLISDAMSTVGTEVTELVLNGRKITRSDGKLTLADGTLAGADLELATAVRVMHFKVGAELSEALRMASRYPAKLANMANVGHLMPGADASIVAMDAKLQPVATWVRGVRHT